MYVVFAEEFDTTPARTAANTVATLEHAFVRICCHCGLSYRFVPEEEGWRLELMDIERPDRSHEPIRSSYKRPRDAQHDLMTQAIDGRIRGHVALHSDVYAGAQVTRTAKGTRSHVAEASVRRRTQSKLSFGAHIPTHQERANRELFDPVQTDDERGGWGAHQNPASAIAAAQACIAAISWSLEDAAQGGHCQRHIRSDLKSLRHLG